MQDEIKFHEEYIKIISAKYPAIKLARSHISLHINSKREYMTTDTAKIFAKVLDVPMEDVC